MTIIFFLIIISMAVALGFLGAYFWATQDGQFDDDYTPAVRILFDDGVKTSKTESKQTSEPQNETGKPQH